MNDRDTHFQKFAELLLEELGGDIAQLMDETADSGDYEGHMRLIIAQRAYDLVVYALQHDWYCHAPDATIQSIPDLTAWTEPPTTAE